MIDTGLAGKTVVVTGAAKGIGRATAERFLAEGCRVAAWDVSDFALEGAHCQRVDVTDSASVERASAEVAQLWGAVDVLVNNAGILRDGLLVKVKEGVPAGAMSEESFDAVVDVNLKGVFLCTRAMVPGMIQAGGGVVLNATSVVGLYGNFGQTNYVASKFGVIGMTKTWARELGRHKIRVNAVAPGFIATEMVRQMPEKMLDQMKAHTPLGRLGEPADIAAAYLWLASDAASFVTGAVLSVDGGIVVGT
jgi:3-oxoacyl-[acyl-carrier protein] reductase